MLGPSRHSPGDGAVVGPGSGSEPSVRALLEQLVELWGGDCCPSVPLHLLFTPLTVTAVLKASDTEVRLPLLLKSQQHRQDKDVRVTSKTF